MISGSIVALVTPMTGEGGLDWDSLASLVAMHVENKTDGIVAMGTTGESATLNVEEHASVVKFVVEQAAGRIPVIAGTGANCTREAIELTDRAMQAGVDACLLVSPYYNKPTQEGLYQHHKAIAEAVAVPQMLYNVPGRTAVDMLPETIARLSGIDNIVAIKEATGDLERGRRVLELCGDNIVLYSGDDATAVELILLGAKGNISVTANVAPAQMSAMCAAALKGDADKARAINETVSSLHENLFVESNPIPVKWALSEMGLIQPCLRLPLTELDVRYHDVVRSSLQTANLI